MYGLGCSDHCLAEDGGIGGVLRLKRIGVFSGHGLGRIGASRGLLVVSDALIRLLCEYRCWLVDLLGHSVDSGLDSDLVASDVVRF